MPLAAVCPDCSRSYKVDDSKAGKKLRCKDCGGIISVPLNASTPVSHPTSQSPAPKRIPVSQPAAPAATIDSDPFAALAAAADSESASTSHLPARQIDVQPRFAPTQTPARSAPTITYQAANVSPANAKIQKSILILGIILTSINGLISLLLFVFGILLFFGATASRGSAGGILTAMGSVIIFLALAVLAVTVTYLICTLKARKGSRAAAIVAVIIASLQILLVGVFGIISAIQSIMLIIGAITSNLPPGTPAYFVPLQIANTVLYIVFFILLVLYLIALFRFLTANRRPY